MGKVSFLAGLGAGYVLGSRAGRERYEQIKQISQRVWQSDPVQNQVESARHTARTKVAPALVDGAADMAKAAADKMRKPTVTAEVVVLDTAGVTEPETVEGHPS